MHVTLETAGTVFRPIDADLVSISPKLANSAPAPGDPRDPAGAWRARHEQRRLRPDVLQRLIDHARSASRDLQLKFVVASPADLPEVDALLTGLTGWRPDDVMLMPEGVASPAPGSTGWIVRACLARGWRYCHRLHLDLFGHVRGT
jgi:7-carboxy-7-deazaguanine synthase